ncbi:MAG: hypothetical protein ACHQX1_02915 [Candidatus Micrarchaeales archaeon]
MEQDRQTLKELLGKKLLIKSHYGIGTKGDMMLGDYKGILLGYDDNFIKIEYEITRFVEGANVVSKSILLINTNYIITIEEIKGEDNAR